MRLVRSEYSFALLVLAFSIIISSCSLFGGGTKSGAVDTTNTPSSSIIVNPTIRNVELDLLNNMKTYGYNADPTINKGLGGLWVNWRYGSQPLLTNVNGTGETDDTTGQPLRHDPLTDLRYIHNLWSYKVQNPRDSSFDGEIARYTPIIKYEFAKSHNERGWLYDEFMALYNLSHDIFYKNTALSLVQSYAKAFDPVVGTIYKITPSYPHGTYRVDLVLESGCALIQAGTLFNNAQWVQEGTSIINFIYTHAYIERYHAFPDQVDNVLLPNGSLNPEEPFLSGRQKNYTVNGRYMQMGNISQIIFSLLDTYQVTHDGNMLSKATDLLDALSLPNNPLGMWDTTYGGYYFSASFNGPSPQQPGSVVIDKKRKEAGRQAIMLQVFHLANKFTHNQYADMESRMQEVALKDIYNSSVHGVLYLVNADWTPQKFHNGTLNDMTTTEAMGAELESLFALNT